MKISSSNDTEYLEIKPSTVKNEHVELRVHASGLDVGLTFHRDDLVNVYFEPLSLFFEGLRKVVEDGTFFKNSAVLTWEAVEHNLKLTVSPLVTGYINVELKLMAARWSTRVEFAVEAQTFLTASKGQTYES